MIINVRVCFVSTVCASLLSVTPHLQSSLHVYMLRLLLVMCHLRLFSYCYHKPQLKPVAVRAYCLALLMNIGLFIVLTQAAKYKAFGLQILMVSLFHMGEYLATALFQPSTLNIGSFVINHSMEYNIAMTASFVEYFVTLYFFPRWHQNTTRVYIGLALALFGDLMRKYAMYTAGESFHHQVQFIKKHNHKLITSGIYSFMRHPSYAGWFCWSVSTQIMLGNVVCFFGFAAASWHFFHERITSEEMTLLLFFQQDYVDYQKRVPFSGVPFVSGYRHSEENKKLS